MELKLDKHECDIDLSEEQIKETLFPFFGVRLFCPFPKSYMFIKKQVIKYGSIV